MMVTTRDAMRQTKEMLIKQYAVVHKKMEHNDSLHRLKGELGKQASFDIDSAIHHDLYGSFKD
jgi:hypothetical protein